MWPPLVRTRKLLDNLQPELGGPGDTPAVLAVRLGSTGWGLMIIAETDLSLIFVRTSRQSVLIMMPSVKLVVTGMNAMEENIRCSWVVCARFFSRVSVCCFSKLAGIPIVFFFATRALHTRAVTQSKSCKESNGAYSLWVPTG